MTDNEKNNYVVLALYKFVALDDFQALQQPILDRCKNIGIKGTLLLASEGINGTVCGDREAINQLIDYFNTDPRFINIEYKESISTEIPFHRMKVKLKNEIVTMGLDTINPAEKTGHYVEPKDWNALISDPDVLVIDTRNTYETQIGKFNYALDPKTDSFTEFPDYVQANLDPEENRKVAMYCTGGIRCEKASAYLLSQGFNEVYQLHGGILKYLEEVNPAESLWKGECFVFDGRVAINEELQQGQYEQCYGCRLPVSYEDRQSSKYEYGISCPACYDSLTKDKQERLRERQKQVELAEQRNERHIGASYDLKGKRPGS